MDEPKQLQLENEDIKEYIWELTQQIMMLKKAVKAQNQIIETLKNEE